MSDKDRKQVLILGAGFAGLYTAIHLEKILAKEEPVDITLIDRNHYHLFTPMLHEAATGVINPSLIMTPIRRILRGKRINFLRARVEKIDLDSKEVTLCCKLLTYDTLVIGLGSVTDFYGMESVREKSLEIKDSTDADHIRCHIINRLEAATREGDIKRRQRLLTFVVVGGGCTGVETVTEVHEYLKHLQKEQYNNISMNEIRTILIEAKNEILPQMGRSLSDTALRRMKKMGVEVILNAMVSDFANDGLEFGGGKDTLPTDTVIWAAGVRASPLLDNLSLQKDKTGRVVVNSDLYVPGNSSVYVLGDAAHAEHPKTGKVYPPTAQVAYRQARIAAFNIAADIRSKPHRLFDFTYIGDLVSLGRLSGVADPGGVRLRGLFAWLMWKFYYLLNLVGWQNRVRIAINWFLALISPTNSLLPNQCSPDCKGDLCL